MYFKNSSLNYIPTTFGGEPIKFSFLMICMIRMMMIIIY
ncbi:hypothetical protein [Staphylococcus aureus]